MLCADQARWIQPQLEWLYPWFARILVVDGARTPDVGCRWGATELPDDVEVAPSSDDLDAALHAFDDGEGKVGLFRRRGPQREVLDAALAELGTPDALVVAADEFALDLPEFLMACERLPDCRAFRLLLTVNGGQPG